MKISHPLKFTFSTLLILAFIQVSAQERYTERYDNGKLKEEGYYDANDQATGTWVFYYESGHINYSGTYEDGLRTGDWKFYDKDQTLLKKINYTNFTKTIYHNDGVSIDGKGPLDSDLEYHGDWKFYHESGRLRSETKYVHGQRTVWKRYYESGKLEQEAYYENTNSKHPLLKNYYENGKLESTGLFIAGTLFLDEAGEWNYYLEDGSLSAVKVYENGFVQTWKEYYENGKVKSSGSYENGTSNRPIWRDYYENGQLKEAGPYLPPNEDTYSKLKVGEWKLYYENGILEKHVRYDDKSVLMDVYELNDKDKNALEVGSFRNGNGLLNVYNLDGKFIKSAEYVDGQRNSNWKYPFRPFAASLLKNSNNVDEDIWEKNKGTAMMIIYGRTWSCPPCRDVLLYANKYYTTWKKLAGFSMVFVLQDPPETAKKYIEDNNIVVPTYTDPESKLLEEYMVDAVPALGIIDPSGVLLHLDLTSGENISVWYDFLKDALNK